MASTGPHIHPSARVDRPRISIDPPSEDPPLGAMKLLLIEDPDPRPFSLGPGLRRAGFAVDAVSLTGLGVREDGSPGALLLLARRLTS